MADVADTHAHATRDTAARSALLRSILDDHTLLGAFLVCLLLIAYQLIVTLLQPSWIKPVTDWLRTGLAWPQLLVVAWLAVHLLRMHLPGTVAWSCVALGMLSYTVARTTWTIADVALYPHGVPFPSLPDLFFLLQYPCFFIGLVFAPALGRWLPGLRTMLDGLLWMSAITALSWYFVLWPIARQTGVSPLAKPVSMLSQIGDLVIFYGLIVALAQPRRTSRAVLIISLLSLAFVSLFVGDTWATVQLFHPPQTYRGGNWPDLFRFICYLLLPLASLVRLRLPPGEFLARPPAPAERLSWRDLLEGISFVLPSLVVVAAAVAIDAHAVLTAQSRADLLLPAVVGIILLLLAVLRPAVMVLEQKQLRRERDTARAHERALRIANERMETFLAVLAHELRTPLTNLIGNVHLMARRLDTLLRPDASREDYTRTATVLRTLVEYCEQSLRRMGRLVEDVLDETRIHRGQLALRLEPCDVAAVVGETVAEQAVLNPERSILWGTEASPVPVMADASRIAQVVTNLVNNALKFSRDDQAVEVRVCPKDKEGVARVTVHDDGVGIPLAEQPHIWEQFYQAEGATVQSGSQVGVGMGLSISKAIIEGHQGRVGVESAPQQGTTIWFTLPLASPRAAASPKDDVPRSPSFPASSSHTPARPAEDGRNT
jgi:signal transduction histidine kinase